MPKYADIPSKPIIQKSILKCLVAGRPEGFNLEYIIGFVEWDLLLTRTALQRVYPDGTKKAGQQIFYHRVKYALQVLKHCKRIIIEENGTIRLLHQLIDK